jgi:hypothetical protein
MPSATLKAPLKVPVKQPVKAASTAPQFDLYAWLVDTKKFKATYFFVGIFIALLACSCAGRLAATKNDFKNFYRFHSRINPTSFFYPTENQMISIVKANSKPEQTIVILGGNSIFYGLGQSVSDLWSVELQRKLGPDFAVFNFAMPASSAFESAYWAAESLLKQHRKVLFATVSIPAQSGSPEGSEYYGYAFWDAKEKHLLCNDRSRDALIAKQLSSFDTKKQTKLDELRLRAKLDSLLYFEDLWNSIGYSNLFTVYSGLTKESPLKARKYFEDNETSGGCDPLETRFKSALDVGSVRSYCKSAFEYQTAIPRPSWWTDASVNMNALVPDPFKRNCLVVVSTHAPGTLSQLNAIENERERLASIKSVETWSQSGYQSLSMRGKLVDEDFRDSRHLLPSGGKKVAQVVATKIIEMNNSLYAHPATSNVH